MASGGSAVGARVLAFGSGHDNPSGSGLVRALQRRLAQAGEEPGPIDGRYGPLTEQTVRRFQAHHGLRVDGIAGPQTLTTLSSPTTVLYPGAGFEEPDGSGLVRALQRHLARAGQEPGPIDGRYGPLTERAVRRFQAAHGLHADGIAGRQLFVELRNQARSRRLASRPRAASQRPPRVPEPKMLRRGHRTGWPSTGWLALLVVLGVVMLGIGTLYTRRRRDHRLTALSATGNSRNQTAGLEREARRGAPPSAVNGLAEARPAFSHPDVHDNANAAFNLGALLEGRGDLAEAETAYRRADHRGHAEAACNLGVLLEEQGDSAGAEAAYRRAADRGDPNGTFNLGALLEGEGDLAGAEAAYRRADHRGHAEAACNLGVLLEEQGDLAGAEAAYGRAADRGDPNGAFDLGALLEGEGDLAGAEAAYRRAEQSGHAEMVDVARAALLDLRVTVAGSNGGNGGDPDAR